MKKKEAGKGDKPRGGFSRRYKDNYDVINWGDTNKCPNAQNAKKNFDEIDLIFVYENGKLILACTECKKNLDKKKEA